MVHGRDSENATQGQGSENVTQGQGGQGLIGVLVCKLRSEEALFKWEMGGIEMTVLNECIAVSNCHFSFIQMGFLVMHSERIRWLVFLVCRRLHGVLGGVPPQR